MPKDQLNRCSNLGFRQVKEFPHALQQRVMPIIAKIDDEIFPVGTGFVISTSGLMMTAGHVVQAAYDKGARRIACDGVWTTYLELYAMYVANETHPDGSVGGMWPIDRFWMHRQTDIGVCRLRGATRRITGIPVRWPTVTLSPGIPAIGTKVWGYGYFMMAGRGGASTDGRQSINFRQSSAYTQGKIVELYPEYRDRHMLSFPCFRIDARFDPGMSGGPIVNENGHVCGIVCSSLPPSHDDDEHLSYGSMIWPALSIKIENIRLQGNSPTTLSLFDLSKKGIISTDDSLDQVRLINLGQHGEFITLKM